jgi:predicted ester cyclase
MIRTTVRLFTCVVFSLIFFSSAQTGSLPLQAQSVTPDADKDGIGMFYPEDALQTVSHAHVRQETQSDDQGNDPETVVRTIFTLLTAGDIDGALALIADNSVSVFLPPPPGFENAMGKEQLREWWTEFNRRNGTVEITELYVHGDKVAFTVNVSEDFFTSLGVAPMVGNMVAIVQRGQLQSATITWTEASQAIFDLAFVRQQNRALAEQIVERLYEEVFNQKNLDVVDELYAIDVIDHDLPDQDGLEAHKQGIADLFVALPDLQVTYEEPLIDDDRVSVRVTFTGTHEGEWLGIAPTSKVVEWSHVDTFRIEDGKITDVWHIVPVGQIQQQLGYHLVPQATE